MQNKWQLKPIAPADFVTQNPEYGKIVLQLLFNRGLINKRDIELFFNPAKVNLADPFLFRDMRSAVELAIKHIKAQNLIVIYGDYDADGVCATAVLYNALKKLGINVGVWIPFREKEGYGFSPATAEHLHEHEKTNLIVTVDCGISNFRDSSAT